MTRSRRTSRSPITCAEDVAARPDRAARRRPSPPLPQAARRLLRGVLTLLALLVGAASLAPAVASAVPAGSEYPASWTITSPTTATGTTPSGTTITATLNAPSTGTLTWTGASGSLIIQGSKPGFFPETTTEALRLSITGCVAAPCGSITYSFSSPVLTPSLYTADIGAQTGGTTIGTYHDHPITIAGGGTFTLDAAGSQSPNMGILDGGNAIGIADVPGQIGSAGGQQSCGQATAGFGCGAYRLNIDGETVSTLTLNFGYEGTDINTDAFSLIIPAIPSAPALTVDKSATPAEIARVGETIDYRFVVRNTGNVTLSDVAIDETDFSGSGDVPDVTCPPEADTMAPGDEVTCTASYTATQDDVDAGRITNTAIATGVPPDSPPVDSPPSTTTTVIPADPRIEIVKTADVESFTGAGVPVTFRFAVSNTGNVTLDPVTVTDPMVGLSEILCPESYLLPGESQTCTATYTTTQADADAGSVTNLATATGQPPTPDGGTPPPPVTDDSIVKVPGIPPVVPPVTPPVAYDLSLVKSASRSQVKVGDGITYTLLAKNAGPDAAVGVEVVDTLPTSLRVVSATTPQGTCAVTGNAVRCQIGTLAAGQSVAVSIRAVAIAAGTTVNSASVVPPPLPPGTPPIDPPGNNTGTSTVKVVKPALGLSKTANRKAIKAGQAVRYTLRVRNPSRSAVRNVRVCDTVPSGMTYVSSSPRAKLAKGQYCWTVKSLGAGKSASFTLTLRATRGTSGTKVNRVTASSPDARSARASRSVRITGARIPAGGVTG